MVLLLPQIEKTERICRPEVDGVGNNGQRQDAWPLDPAAKKYVFSLVLSNACGLSREMSVVKDVRLID